MTSFADGQVLTAAELNGAFAQTVLASALSSASGASSVGCQASGTGAVQRTVEAKLQELLLSVTDYANLQEAYNALPSSGGGVVYVPPEYSETLTANLVMNKPFSGFVFMGSANIQLAGYQIIMNDGCPGQFIDKMGSLSGGDYWAQVNQGVFFKYTGSAQAIQVGQGTLQSGSTEDCFRILRGFALNIEYASTGAIGIQVNNQLRMTIEGVNCKSSGGGTGGVVGCQLNAVGSGYVGWVNIKDSFFSGGQIGVQTVGQVNLCTWSGGGCSTTTTSGTTWGIKRGTNGGSGFFASNIELAGCTRAVELQSGVSFDTYEIYGESNTYDVYFDSGASNNFYKNTAASTAPLISDGNGATSTNVAVGAGSDGASNLYVAGNGNALYGKTSSNNWRKLVSFGGSSTLEYGDIVGDILVHQWLTSSGSAGTITDGVGLALTKGLGVYGATPPAQVTGWGTPTGAAVQSNFSGSSATLAQTSAAVAKIITDLKAAGIYAA